MLVGLVLSVDALRSEEGIARRDAKPTPLVVLPKECYAVVGNETNIYFRNTVVTTPKGHSFSVECNVGKVDGNRWTFTPSTADVGIHSLAIALKSESGKTVATAKTDIRVTRANAGEKDELSLLVIGDSLTHATAYPNEIARLLAQPGNPKWKMLGTHKPKSAADRVAHEGYGGWTWSRFVSKFEPNPDGTHGKRSSPFVFLGKDKAPKLDFARYVKESCGNHPPDFVVIMLGINDCFSANPNDVDQIDERVDVMFAQAKILLKSIRAAAPDAQIGVCLTTPGNSRDGAYYANYKDRYTRTGWDRIQRRLVYRQILHFSGRESEQLFVVPTELNLDIVDGYPENNGVHPNGDGYRQIGSSIYAWLKWRLASSHSSSLESSTQHFFWRRDFPKTCRVRESPGILSDAARGDCAVE